MDDKQDPAENQPDAGRLVPRDLSGIYGPASVILDEMADLLGKHKLVPFFGAGVSRNIWDSLLLSWRRK